jgi:hypothetical protein
VYHQTKEVAAPGALMANYRMILLGHDGYLVESTFVSCADDNDALSVARKMLRTFDAAIEVWDGSRKVEHLEVDPVYRREATADRPGPTSGSPANHA